MTGIRTRDFDLPGEIPPTIRQDPNLDEGEAQAIALALELKADLLLMDERKGTQAARELGLATIGVLGVLLDAKRAGWVDEVSILLDRLITELHFYVSPELRYRFRELAEE